MAGGVPAHGGHDCPQLISMWVDPERRGTETADELLVAVIGWAKESGASALRLDVADGNERARRFYQRAGFVPTGRSRPLPSNPDVATRELLLTWD